MLIRNLVGTDIAHEPQFHGQAMKSKRWIQVENPYWMMIRADGKLEAGR